MKVSVEHLSPVKRALSVEVEPSVVGDEFASAYAELGRRVKVAGFRPGKVPLAVLEKRFHREVTDDVVNRLVPRFYDQAIKQAGLVPVQLPTIDQLSVSRDAPLSFRAVVEVRPAIALQPYRGLPLQRRRVVVDVPEVDAAIENLRLRQAELVSTDEGHTVAEGDFAIVDFEGSVDGKPLPDAGAKAYVVHVGAKSVVPEIETALSGRRRGDHFDAEVTYPADHHNPQLAGQRVLFRVTVVDVKRQVLPALDDELAKDVGVESLAVLRDRVRSEITRRKEADQRAEERRALLKALVDRHQVDLPPSLVQREAALIRDRMERHFEAAAQARPVPGVDPETLTRQAAVAAEERVKGDLLLEAIAEREALDVGSDEIEHEVQRLAAETRSDVREMRRILAGDSGEFVGLRATLRREKALDWLIEHAEVREEDGSTGGQEPR
ncbi:MAG: trigger factor [Nitrospirota bacterium]